MKKIDLYEMAIKLAGISLIVVLIGQLRDVMLYASLLIQSKNNSDFSSNFNQMPTFLVVLFSFLFLAAFTSLFLFKTKAVAKIICSKEDFEKPITLFIDRKNTYEIALLLVGLVTIILSLPDFILHLKNYVQALKGFSGNPMDTTFLITDGTKIAVGVLAVLYAKPLASYFGESHRLPKSN